MLRASDVMTLPEPTPRWRSDRLHRRRSRPRRRLWRRR
jgi:hypothetical protein